MNNMSNAGICRANGWGPGTRLVGDEGYGPTVIQITAVGDEVILARAISHNGARITEREATWTLACRDWKPVRFNEPASSPHDEAETLGNVVGPAGLEPATRPL
jgi:hypothetical protein